MYGAMVISRDADFLEHTKRFVGNINKDIEITCVEDPDRAAAILASPIQIDVIVCDHDPPRIDAISVFNDRNRVNDLRPFIIITKKADGNVAIKAFELRMDYYLSRDKVINFYMDLASKIVLCAERKKQEMDRALNERRMKALINLANMHNYSFNDILNYALESSVSLTNSQVGYVAMFEHDTQKLKMMAWSHAGLDLCKMKNRPIYYDLETTGVWGEPVRQKRSIIINDYLNGREYPKKDMPTGHVQLHRLMMIPIFHNGVVVATAGVANKVGEYTEDDEMQFILLMDGLLSIYKERMLEEETIESERKLEDILKYAPVGVILLDDDLSIVECNLFADKLIKSHNFCLSKTPLRDQTNDIVKIILSEINHVKEDRNMRDSEHVVVRDGSRSVLKFISSVTNNSYRKNTGFIVIIDDMTEIADANLALRNTLDRMNTLDLTICDMTKRITNELRTKISNLKDESDYDALSKDLGYLDEMLVFIEEYHGIGMRGPEWQEVKVIVDRAAEAFKLSDGTLKCNTDGVSILVDSTFYNVFRYLFYYSVREAGASKISIRCRLDKGNMVIVYCDNGKGIPYESKENFVFEQSKDFGLGMFFVGKSIGTSNFTCREIGTPGEGMIIEMTFPASYYSVTWDE